MYKCKCGREFKTQQGYNMHKPHCKGIRYCQNPECGIILTKPDQKKFCSTSCSAKINNIGQIKTIETRKKISKSLQPKNKLKYVNCTTCNKLTFNTKYCSIKCKIKDREYKNKKYILRKEILWNEQGQKCAECGFNLYEYKDGPYQIHHIDGNKNNFTKENEILLCCNCHYMTDNYAFKNRNHTQKSKSIISKKVLNYIRKSSNGQTRPLFEKL